MPTSRHARALTGRTKREQVRQYVLEQARPEFRFVDIVAALPDISPATIREALNESHARERSTAAAAAARSGGAKASSEASI